MVPFRRLTGQIVAGLLMDHVGLLGLAKRKITKRWLNCVVTTAGFYIDHYGEIVMLLLFVIIALSNGLCIILSRGINGRLSCNKRRVVLFNLAKSVY